MAIDKKTLNAIKNHLLSKKQIVLGSFDEKDINYIVSQLRQEGLNVTIQGNKLLLTEQIEQKPKVEEQKVTIEQKPEAKTEVKVKEEVKVETKTEAPKEEQKVTAETKPKEEQKPKQKKSVAVHIRLPLEYVNYVTSINSNITFALKLIIYQHAKSNNVTLPEPKQTQSGMTKKERKMLKECLDLQTKEEILQCLQSKLMK